VRASETEGPANLTDARAMASPSDSPSPQAAPGADLAVDFDHLQRFTMGNRALECEVLALFRTQSHSCLERLRQARDDQDWKMAAHTLKGAAAGIGAWAVHEASQAAERMEGETRMSGGAAAIGVLEAAVSETDAMIAQFLNE